MQPDISVPTVLAGPILREITPDRLTIWLAVRSPAEVWLELFPEGADPRLCRTGPDHVTVLKAGEKLHYLLITVPMQRPLPTEHPISYRLSLKPEDEPGCDWQDHTVWAPDICYPGRELPFFQVPERVRSLFHGSCRKPHSSCEDGLVAADRVMEERIAEADKQGGQPDLPSFLVMSGDQVYVDDVGGPMLQTIMAVSKALGLPDEKLEGINDGLPATGSALTNQDGFLYQRDKLLPKIDQNAGVFDVLFGGTRKPIFTSAHARNHLLTLSEMLCMYLLVWSPEPWKLGVFQVGCPADLSGKDREMYRAEMQSITRFIAGLSSVRRLFAHLPTAMIFDDHDVTDDWNLSLAWEQAAYGHPLSRRVIGNALVAYGINQGWGNRPETILEALQEPLQDALSAPGSEKHDAAIQVLLDFEEWDFQWETSPPLIALDTRTRRWRSERNSHFPSGLLDWEAATDLQSHLKGRDAVLLVSAAPIFGVKLIETVQRFFTLIGKPLMVDAEYWMAHPGTAEAILNVFRHRNTPKNFVILSGDVHYSFVYDVELRHRKNRANGPAAHDPEIWQICSSGIKNAWPDRLIKWLDHGNRLAFSPRSPLNWFTIRRGMKVTPRKPVGTPHGRRILNASGIGLVELNEDGAPVKISQVTAEGSEVPFERRELEARLD